MVVPRNFLAFSLLCTNPSLDQEIKKKALSQSPVRCFSLARANQEKWACLISQNDFLRTVNLDTGWMRVNSCLTADHDALTGFWEVNAE